VLLNICAFARAADPVRFAVEKLPSDVLLGAYLKVHEKRYDSREIVGCMNALNIRSRASPKPLPLCAQRARRMVKGHGLVIANSRAAIDRNCRALNVFRFLRAEKQRECSNVGGFA
jgi:hypothetical protein